MKKTDEELLEEIAGFLHGYLKDGTVSLTSFFSKINLDINNLQDLLKIRFLLMSETKEFVEKLPLAMKNIKTSTIAETGVHYGEIRGQIDWQETIKERLNQNYRDKTIFSTSENVRTYNTSENLVMKELLGVLYFLLFEQVTVQAFEQRRWYKEWQGLRGVVAHAYLKNIYMQRTDLVTVSDRVLVKTLQHRNKLYRDAAALLMLYRKLMGGNSNASDIERVLAETLIVPEDRNVLFELYWIVQLIKSNTDTSQLYLMNGKQNVVASLEKDTFTYFLYHDSTGSHNIKFQVNIDEVENSMNPYLTRIHTASLSYKELANKYFNEDKSDVFWRGRPDFIIEKYDQTTNQLTKVVIGEIKNTTDQAYASTGLAELIDYLHLIKWMDGRYLYGTDVELKGVLCLRGVKFNKGMPEDLITIVSDAVQLKKIAF